jgi:very-short-patch-repair endonuclease
MRQNPEILARRRLLKRQRSRQLRSATIEPERRLWSLLRGKQVAGLRFRRQQTIGPYIVDFYCSAAKLIVELDGDQHGEDRHVAYDAGRTRWLAGNGYRVLRFSNTEFLRDPQLVLDGIWRAIEESGVPLPEPVSALCASPGSTLPRGEGRLDRESGGIA